MQKTVLLNETIEGLNLERFEKGVVLDGTFGGGGHSLLICKKYPKVKIVALDQDNSVLERAKDKFENCDITFYNSNFRDLDKVLEKEEIGKVNGIIFDLGLSSDQLEASGRGFSFLKNEPLLMTMKENPVSEDLSARDIVNDWSEESLGKIIQGYGEEKFWKRIAHAIAVSRENKKIETTTDLVRVIEEAVPSAYKRGKLHFATRTFQAIRIAVNDELGALREGLEKGWEALEAGGRIGVISFHSLEDRIVKKFSKEKKEEGKGRLINKKPIGGSKEEIKENPRARSAKLRIIEKLK